MRSDQRAETTSDFNEHAYATRDVERRRSDPVQQGTVDALGQGLARLSSRSSDVGSSGFSNSFNEVSMFLTIAIVLLVLWALGFFAFHIAGGMIHIILVIAVIAIVWHFLKASSTTRV
jgi:hypothetical protein